MEKALNSINTRSIQNNEKGVDLVPLIEALDETKTYMKAPSRSFLEILPFSSKDALKHPRFISITFLAHYQRLGFLSRVKGDW